MRVDVDLSGLEYFIDKIGRSYVARVGILGSDASALHKNEDDDDDEDLLTNAELGVIHEYGSETNNIPPRSFLRMPLEEKSKELLNETGKLDFENTGEKQLYKQLGVIAENIVRMAFKSSGYGKWMPNKTETVRAKGSSKPLIATSQLRRAISSDVVKRSEVDA